MQKAPNRAYYRLALTPSTADTRKAQALGQGVVGSKFAHENPVYRPSPDGKSAILRIHWPTGYGPSSKSAQITKQKAEDAKRDAYAESVHVTKITDLEAAALVAEWYPVE